MTREHIAAITEDRLRQWADSCIEAHATPAFLLAFGHDHASGEWHLCVPENPPPELENFIDCLQETVRLRRGVVLTE